MVKQQNSEVNKVNIQQQNKETLGSHIRNLLKQHNFKLSRNRYKVEIQDNSSDDNRELNIISTKIQVHTKEKKSFEVSQILSHLQDDSLKYDKMQTQTLKKAVDTLFDRLLKKKCKRKNIYITKKDYQLFINQGPEIQSVVKNVRKMILDQIQKYPKREIQYKEVKKEFDAHKNVNLMQDSKLDKEYQKLFPDTNQTENFPEKIEIRSELLKHIQQNHDSNNNSKNKLLKKIGTLVKMKQNIQAKKNSLNLECEEEQSLMDLSTITQEQSYRDQINFDTPNQIENQNNMQIVTSISESKQYDLNQYINNNNNDGNYSHTYNNDVNENENFQNFSNYDDSNDYQYFRNDQYNRSCNYYQVFDQQLMESQIIQRHNSFFSYQYDQELDENNLSVFDHNVNESNYEGNEDEFISNENVAKISTQNFLLAVNQQQPRSEENLNNKEGQDDAENLILNKDKRNDSSSPSDPQLIGDQREYQVPILRNYSKDDFNQNRIGEQVTN